MAKNGVSRGGQAQEREKTDEKQNDPRFAPQPRQNFKKFGVFQFWVISLK
jgi:hypothetical protein